MFKSLVLVLQAQVLSHDFHKAETPILSSIIILLVKLKFFER